MAATLTLVGVAVAACAVTNTRAVPVNLGGLRRHTPSVAMGRTLSPVVELLSSLASWARSRPQGGVPGGSVEFRYLQFHTLVSNPGAAFGFTMFGTTAIDVDVTPASAAQIEQRDLAPPTFALRADKARWEAEGQPPLPYRASGVQAIVVPSEQFSFIPQGASLTYREVEALPASPTSVTRVIDTHLRAYAGEHPASYLILREFGFLLATGPLTVKVRGAIWQGMAALPGIHLCGLGTDLLGRRGQGVCVDSPYVETEVIVSPRTGTVLAVLQRINRATDFFPTLPAHTLVESDTFVSKS
jgi:hypothetical protein